MRYWFFCALFLCASCTHEHLYVRNDYLTPETLASTQVGAPDYRRECPSIGQRIMIYWDLPPECMDGEVELVLHLRYRNSEYNIIRRPIRKARDSYVYSVLDDDYCYTQGVLTFKVEVQVDRYVAYRWRHQIWVQPIEIFDNREGMEELDLL